MKQILFLLLVLFMAVALPMFLKLNTLETFQKRNEAFSNYTLAGGMGSFPSSETNYLVQESYPKIEKKGISENNSRDIWWHYPIFHLGSYKQITNNLKHPNNPDEGTCMPASMCGALYHEKQTDSNYTVPLPTIDPSVGTRVGYFKTNENLLPFRTNVTNILY
jgi:hypothetical protein